MTKSESSSDFGAEGVDSVQVDAVYRHVKAIDPEATHEAVARYVREIAEMADALRAADIDRVPASSDFSPAWEGGEAS